jgi:hypothetical protein
MSDDAAYLALRGIEHGYWPRLIAKSAHYYLRHGRILACLRTLFTQVVLHDNTETCQRCGRRYMLWMAPDDVYRRIIGSSRGLWCPRCFDRRAGKLSYSLVWTPQIHRLSASAPSTLPEISERIGAFSE